MRNQVASICIILYTRFSSSVRRQLVLLNTKDAFKDGEILTLF